MFAFFKNNSDNILKLSVNQIAMTIFGLLLTAATYSNKKLLFATGVLSAVFYLYLIYTTAWDIGARDKIKIDGGRMDKNSSKGALLGIGANVINIILILTAIICFYLADNLHLQWAANTTAITGLIAYLINGMYIAVISFAKILPFNFELFKLFLLLFTVIISVLVSFVAYLAGVSNFRVLNALGINRSAKK